MTKRLILYTIALVLLTFCIASCSETQTPITASTEEQTIAQTNDDVKITDDLRERYFDLSRKLRFDRLPEFERGVKPLFTEMKWYLFHFEDSKYVDSDSENKSYISGKDFEKLTSRYFDTSYNLSDSDKVFFEFGEYVGPPFMELKKFSEKTLEAGKKEITVDLYEYGYDFQMFYLTDKQQREHPYLSGTGEVEAYITELINENDYTYFEACKDIVIKGDTDILHDPGNIYVITYITSDGVTPDQFVSVKRHSAYAPGKYTGNYELNTDG